MGTMQEILPKAEVQCILGSIIKDEGIEDARLEISKGSEKGDGYLSFITRVDVHGKNKNLHVVIKYAPRSEEIRKMVPIRICYEREIYMYDEVLKNMIQFQLDKKVKEPFLGVPKCYKTSTEMMKELLVLENIKEEGFALWNRQKLMPNDHMELIFKEYGKYHGVSFAMKDQRKEYFDSIEPNLGEIFTKQTAPPEMFTTFYEAMDKIKDIFCPEKEKEYYDKSSTLKEAVQTFMDMIETDHCEYAVVCHGDCWCNNMMFKYEDKENPTKPTKLCLLDFQISKLSSPVIDLSYFFYISAAKENMDNLDYYLKLYYESYCKHVRNLGSDPEKLFPFDKLKSEWRKYCKFGFIMSTMVLKAMLRESDEIVDLTDVGADSNMMELFTKESRSDVLVNKRLKGIIIHLYENDFI